MYGRDKEKPPLLCGPARPSLWMGTLSRVLPTDSQPDGRRRPFSAARSRRVQRYGHGNSVRGSGAQGPSAPQSVLLPRQRVLRQYAYRKTTAVHRPGKFRQTGTPQTAYPFTLRSRAVRQRTHLSFGMERRPLHPTGRMGRTAETAVTPRDRDRTGRHGQHRTPNLD